MVDASPFRMERRTRIAWEACDLLASASSARSIAIRQTSGFLFSALYTSFVGPLIIPLGLPGLGAHRRRHVDSSRSQESRLAVVRWDLPEELGKFRVLRLVTAGSGGWHSI